MSDSDTSSDNRADHQCDRRLLLEPVARAFIISISLDKWNTVYHLAFLATQYPKMPKMLLGSLSLALHIYSFLHKNCATCTKMRFREGDASMAHKYFRSTAAFCSTT